MPAIIHWHSFTSAHPPSTYCYILGNDWPTHAMARLELSDLSDDVWCRLQFEHVCPVHHWLMVICNIIFDIRQLFFFLNVRHFDSIDSCSMSSTHSIRFSCNGSTLSIDHVMDHSPRESCTHYQSVLKFLILCWTRWLVWMLGFCYYLCAVSHNNVDP